MLNTIASMTRSLLFVCLVGGATAGLLGGCKPKAGAGCKIEMKEVCVDAKAALVCHDGKWEDMTCRGAAGCSKVGPWPAQTDHKVLLFLNRQTV